MRKLKCMVLIVLLAVQYSCSSNDSIRISYSETADGWLNEPKGNEFYFSEKADIPIIFIEMDKLDEATVLLENIFYKTLTDEEYEYFTGNKKKYTDTAYVIRSVNYSFNEYGYRIYISDKNNLLISHSVLSSRKWKGVQKWPIIIIYNDLDTINEIYTSYSVAK